MISKETYDLNYLFIDQYAYSMLTLRDPYDCDHKLSDRKNTTWPFCRQQVGIHPYFASVSCWLLASAFYPPEESIGVFHAQLSPFWLQRRDGGFVDGRDTDSRPNVLKSFW